VKWKQGDQEAMHALMPLVYEELRRLAHRHLQAERDDHTLRSTELGAYPEVCFATKVRMGVRWAGVFHKASHDRFRPSCDCPRAIVPGLSLDCPRGRPALL
jgi:hypothetical protein